MTRRKLVVRRRAAGSRCVRWRFSATSARQTAAHVSRPTTMSFCAPCAMSWSVRASFAWWAAAMTFPISSATILTDAESFQSPRRWGRRSSPCAQPLPRRRRSKCAWAATISTTPATFISGRYTGSRYDTALAARRQLRHAARSACGWRPTGRIRPRVESMARKRAALNSANAPSRKARRFFASRAGEEPAKDHPQEDRRSGLDRAHREACPRSSTRIRKCSPPASSFRSSTASPTC